MIAALLAMSLSGSPVMTDVDQIKENMSRVDRSIEETETLLHRTPTAKYVPELRFRLCELTVEKSRLLYGLQAAQQSADQGPLVSPEVRLLKEKAVSMYARLLREIPRYSGNDKVRFYLAHEQRELGKFDDMVETLEQLVKKHPKSPLSQDAELILGDYQFDKTNLDEAEKHYRNVLRKPLSPAHDLARYKLGWIEVNRGDHAKAIPEFEAVITGRKSKDDSKKVLDVRREALIDLVYSYTEVKPAKGALQYFEKLSDSVATYSLVLDKLAGRYLVKTQPENAIVAYRKLLSLRADPERDEERALALYDTIHDSAGKLSFIAQDVSFAVRAAVQLRKSVALPENERKQRLAALEQVARDMSTKIHLQAQKKDDAKLFVEAAQAYAEYLSLFRPVAHANEVMKNRADALYAARDYTNAARQFEALAKATDGSDPKIHEEATYGALVAYKASVGDDDKLERSTRFEVADARAALKRMGQTFVKEYPKNPNVPEVRFNIARAHFDDGEYKQASDGFLAFATAYPDHKDAEVAGHLALDSLYKTHDFKKLDTVGKQLLASNLPDSFKAEARKVLDGVAGERMTEMALASAERNGGDVVKGLEQVAKEAKDEPTQAKALQGAMLAAREKGDYEKEKELAKKLIDEHGDNPVADDLELSLAQRAIETGRFSEAAHWYEQASEVLEGKKAEGALRSAGNLYVATGDLEKGTAILEQVAAKMQKADRAELLASLAEEWLQQGNKQRAAQEAQKAFGVDVNNARAAAVLAEAAPDKRASELLAVADGEPAARGLWHLAEEEFDSFSELDGSKLEQKVAAWQSLQQTYSQIMQQGSPEWTVASLWRMGLAYQDLANTMKEVPVPNGMSKQDFLAAIEEQAAPLRESAEKTFGICVQKADEHGVFTEAAMGCRAKSEDVKVAAMKAPKASPNAQVPADLQKKVDTTKNAESLNALALGWLTQGNPSMAKLVFAKALEVNKSFAPAQVGLGFALLQLNEPSAAGAAYKEALQMEPSNALAHGNLAALKCRYGDSAGARAELEQIGDKSQLHGPASDPGWKSCVEALSRR